MAAFLRKSLARKKPEPFVATPFVHDVPPSLPPLRLDLAIADPAPAPTLPPAASPPVAPPAPVDLTTDDLWDPWKDTPDARLDAPLRLHAPSPPRPTPVATAPPPGNHPRPQKPTRPSFDFEASLSAAHLHSVMSKPRSSSSLSSSTHTDASRSFPSSTSASSLSPPSQLDGRLDPLGSHTPLANARTRSASIDVSPRPPCRTHRPAAPPTSYVGRTHTLVRHASHSNLSSPSPMLFDMLRSGNPELAVPIRKGPLIFAAEHASPPRMARPAQHNLSPTLPSTEPPPLHRKSSKNSLARVAIERTPAAGSKGDAASDHAHPRPRVLTKARPTTPQKPSTPPHTVLPEPGDPLLLDEDPFARVEGVRMMRPRTLSTVSSSSPSLRLSKEDGSSSDDGHVPPVPNVPVTPRSSNDGHAPVTPPRSSNDGPDSASPPTPVTPDDYKAARQQRRGLWLEKAPPPAVAEVAKQLSMELAEEPPREPTPPPPTYFPIMAFMSNADLLPELLSYLSYSEWLALYSANKEEVRALFQSRILREFVLERFLSTVGYSKWNYEWAEPLALSLKDLHNYLRGVAMPAHEYARLSAAYLHPKIAGGHAPARVADTPDILTLALTTRAYTRLVLRLRAQAESEARYLKTLQSTETPGTRQPSVSSRAPSPTSSSSHSRHPSRGKHERRASSVVSAQFRSPLYRPGRAPVLRVFVPSPEGDWLSDASVVECEAELKRSGVLKLLRVGDIVWDAAVGDEGNLGRLMWDGSYLVDLDYRYSRVGELSPYFHSLAFSPSYFHRVVRIGGSATHNPHCNPIVYMDVGPWGREIATNLQLLQDRARTETPHGALHDVVRWVHRSTFTIRPPVAPHQATHTRTLMHRVLRIPIPNTDGFFIDPGWYGTVVLETEGTNEGLSDLQARCGPGVFPPRAETLVSKMRSEKDRENRRVWRILREKSRPGEIWLRAVQAKERLM